jgi:hypothetical protein
MFRFHWVEIFLRGNSNLHGSARFQGVTVLEEIVVPILVSDSGNAKRFEIPLGLISENKIKIKCARPSGQPMPAISTEVSWLFLLFRLGLLILIDYLSELVADSDLLRHLVAFDLLLFCIVTSRSGRVDNG